MSHRSLLTVTYKPIVTDIVPKAQALTHYLHKEPLPVSFPKNNCCFPSPGSLRISRPSNFPPRSTLKAASSKTQVLTTGNHRQSGSPFQSLFYDPPSNLTVKSKNIFWILQPQECSPLLGRMAHTCNPSTQKVEAGHPQLQNRLKSSPWLHKTESQEKRKEKGAHLLSRMKI